jgi:hypothetical protein
MLKPVTVLPLPQHTDKYALRAQDHNLHAIAYSVHPQRKRTTNQVSSSQSQIQDPRLMIRR